MSVIKAIRDVLEELATDKTEPMGSVYYGACQERVLDAWNYFVYNRRKTTKSSNRLDFQTYYEVHIVHEDYIPEGYVERVVKALEDYKDVTLRVTADDIDYDYTFKGGANTNTIIEIATITLYHPEKRC